MSSAPAASAAADVDMAMENPSPSPAPAAPVPAPAVEPPVARDNNMALPKNVDEATVALLEKERKIREMEQRIAALTPLAQAKEEEDRRKRRKVIENLINETDQSVSMTEKHTNQQADAKKREKLREDLVKYYEGLDDAQLIAAKRALQIQSKASAAAQESYEKQLKKAADELAKRDAEIASIRKNYQQQLVQDTLNSVGSDMDTVQSRASYASQKPQAQAQQGRSFSMFSFDDNDDDDLFTSAPTGAAQQQQPTPSSTTTTTTQASAAAAAAAAATPTMKTEKPVILNTAALMDALRVQLKRVPTQAEMVNALEQAPAPMYETVRASALAQRRADANEYPEMRDVRAMSMRLSSMRNKSRGLGVFDNDGNELCTVERTRASYAMTTDVIDAGRRQRLAAAFQQASENPGEVLDRLHAMWNRDGSRCSLTMKNRPPLMHQLGAGHHGGMNARSAMASGHYASF